MSELQATNSGESPFDAIRLVRDDGSEYWSARDLADVLRYDQWRNFASAIDRARVSLNNQGYDAEDHIAGASKMIETGKGARRAVDDHHLTRFGAYLTVMNGDPRKPEVAAAQAYFASKTREAETRPALPDITTPDGLLALTQMFSDTAKQLVAEQSKSKVLEAAIERAAPLVAKAEAHTGSNSDVHRQEFAREVQAWGSKQNVEIRQADVLRFLGHIGLFIRGERSDTGHATAEAQRRGFAFTHKDVARNGYAYAVGKLTPSGQDYAWKRITSYVGEHRTLALPRELRGGDPA